MNKTAAYQELVKKRKGFKFSHPELTNPSATAFDLDHVEPWAQWQGNLDASIVVIGQEFCDLETYNKVKGTVERVPDVYEYPSNRNLAEYFALLGYDPGHPLQPNQATPIFFTNSVMALKNGSMSANFRDSWMKESRDEFLRPLLDIIQPKVIIAIGTKPTITLGKIYGFSVGPHSLMVSRGPLRTTDGPLIFPVYHTGGLGLRNRSKALQIEDWKRIKSFL